MRQFGMCGYCRCVLTDAAQTDHMDENCANADWCNLIACCGTCHADKTQHFRKGRQAELERMLASGRRNKAAWDEQWTEQDDHWARLPAWLKSRVTVERALVYAARRRAALLPAMDIEQFRYAGVK